MTNEPLRIGLVGLHGHGQWHLRNLHRLEAIGKAKLVAVCDLIAPNLDTGESIGSAVYTNDFDEFLNIGLDIAILCTPIHTHVDLAAKIAERGINIFLEKPTAPSIDDFDRLVKSVNDADIACQVGFQALGSGVVDGIRKTILAGEIGPLVGVGGAAMAVRTAGYYGRGTWAGRRRLTGPSGETIHVVDGALTNPFIHAMAGALRVAGGEEDGRVIATELEMYRAHDIEADDTSVARVFLDDGLPLVVAVTTCGPKTHDPYLIFHGTAGRIVWHYKQDTMLVRTDDGSGSSNRVVHYGRTDLLENLIEHLTTGVDLIVPVESTRASTGFVDAVRLAKDPTPLDSAFVETIGDGPERRYVIDEVGEVVRKSAEDLCTFREQGAPWAENKSAQTTLSVDGTTVANYQLEPGISAELSPRPYLHPVQTLGGTVVSDALPLDHPWHLGVGPAIADVGGSNIWGGRTYVRDFGYVWLNDHGSARHLAWLDESETNNETSLSHRIAWLDPGNRALMIEERLITSIPFKSNDKNDSDSDSNGWVLRFRSEYRNLTESPLLLGSPGSNGRDQGGYGGFFWRLPAIEPQAQVWTETATGADDIHGTVGSWLAWNATTETGAPFTLLATQEPVLLNDVSPNNVSPNNDAPPGNESTIDPWFVRTSGYAGFGAAIAWDRPLAIPLDRVVSREISVLIIDGHHQQAAELQSRLVSTISKSLKGQTHE